MAEKGVNDIPRDVRPLFTKGNDALARENFDYAIDLFNQVLAREPRIYDCRKALRAAQFGKAGSDRGFFKKAWSSASSSPQVAKAQMALRKDPVEALAVAEQVLGSDPNNSGAHKVVVEAATALELPRTKVLSLDILVKNHPRDKALAVQLANALADIGDVQRAERTLSELLRITPELRRLIVGWATTEELRRLAVAQGMRTMLREGMALVENDVTTVPEVIKTLYAN